MRCVYISHIVMSRLKDPPEMDAYGPFSKVKEIMGQRVRGLVAPTFKQLVTQRSEQSIFHVEVKCVLACFLTLTYLWRKCSVKNWRKKRLALNCFSPLAAQSWCIYNAQCEDYTQ